MDADASGDLSASSQLSADALIACEALCAVFMQTTRGALYSKSTQASVREIVDQLRSDPGVSAADTNENG